MRKNQIISIFSALLLLTLSCSREQIKPLNVKRNFTGSLWIVRNSISTPKKIDKLLDMIEDSDIKNLFIQVRGRGDAYYNSSIEPKGYNVKKGFDPLSYIISRTRDTDIRIHAWVNVSLVMSESSYSGDPDHILIKHPEWVTYDYQGRPMSEYSARELKENLLEGLFIDPAIPEVKQHIYKVINDILSNYNVDGIHLDYIRYPFSGYSAYYKRYLSDFGYNPAARNIFIQKYGFDPITIDREKESEQKKLFDNFREEQVTEIVKNINTIVKQQDRSIIVSCAVMPRYDYGKKVYFQNWPDWLEKGYIDLACVMSYTEDKDAYSNYIRYALDTGYKDKIFMGIMINEKTKFKTITEQIDASYSAGMRGYILFSFDHNEEYIRKISDVITYNRYVFKLY